MAGKRDYYEVLGVSRTATDKEITRAFQKIGAKCHPDRNRNKSEAEQAELAEIYKEANEAFQTLKDPDTRQAYDDFGHDYKDTMARSGTDSGPTNRPPPPKDFKANTMEDYRDMFDVADDRPPITRPTGVPKTGDVTDAFDAIRNRTGQGSSSAPSGSKPKSDNKPSKGKRKISIADLRSAQSRIEGVLEDHSGDMPGQALQELAAALDDLKDFESQLLGKGKRKPSTGRKP